MNEKDTNILCTLTDGSGIHILKGSEYNDYEDHFIIKVSKSDFDMLYEAGYNPKIIPSEGFMYVRLYPMLDEAYIKLNDYLIEKMDEYISSGDVDLVLRKMVLRHRKYKYYKQKCLCFDIVESKILTKEEL